MNSYTTTIVFQTMNMINLSQRELTHRIICHSGLLYPAIARHQSSQSKLPSRYSISTQLHNVKWLCITSYSILILDYNSFCVMSDLKSFKENTFTHLKYDRIKITQFWLMFPSSYVPPTSLSRPPWPEVSYISSDEEERHHKGGGKDERCTLIVAFWMLS